MKNQNETIELKITDISDMGQGIGRIENVVVFVDGALPGDTVEARIYEKKKKFYKAKVIDFIESSPDRTKPVCPYSNECGGCAYMSLNYETQLKIKKTHLEEKLRRIGDITGCEIESVIGMKDPYHYRNKTEFAIAKNGVVGFNRHNTNQIVDIPQCHISWPAANEISQVIRNHIKTDKLGMKKVTIRSSFSTGEIMVVLHTNITDKDRLIPLIEKMDDAVNNMCTPEGHVAPSLESVYVFNEEKKKNQYKLIAGKRTINDQLLGMKFEISPASFYQTNPTQTEILFNKVKEYVAPKGDEHIFDLYCGVGSIGLTLADSVKEVQGIESVKDAVLDANRNAVINGIINATYVTGKSEDLIGELKINKDSIILLDPPRAGCKPEVLEKIGKGGAGKIVYVSCDPGTFARDAKILGEYGYTLEKITPVDMFPQTVHLEVIGLFAPVNPVN